MNCKRGWVLRLKSKHRIGNSTIPRWVRPLEDETYYTTLRMGAWILPSRRQARRYKAKDEVVDAIRYRVNELDELGRPICTCYDGRG